MTTSNTAQRRSPLHGAITQAGAASPGANAAAVSLGDLSLCDRAGFKGAGTPAWLASFGVALPQQANTLLRADDGPGIGRLSASEFVLWSEHSMTHTLLARLRASWRTDRPADCYLMPKGDGQAMFALAGPQVFEMLAKMSPVDFRPRHFPAGSIAQTTCARVTTQILHLADHPGTEVLLLVDASYAVHLWESIVDAMGEYDGRIDAPAIGTQTA